MIFLKHTRHFWALLCLVFLVTGCTAGRKESVVMPPAATDSGTEFPFLPDASALLDAQKINPEAAAFLTVPGTTLREAVLRGKDNEKYLRRNLAGDYSYAGSLFLDYRNKTGHALSRNTIVYGHNLGRPMGLRDDPDAAKFAQLFKFTKPEFARENPYLYLTTNEKQYVFQVFSVFYGEAYLKPVEYHHPTYSDEEFVLLLEDVKARSLYDYGVAVSTHDKLLTLSTCSYKYGSYSKNPNQRFVVMARLVRKGESYSRTVDATVRESPKEPQF